jgi:hypothetical protein
MLKTPLQRLSLLCLICGLAAFAFGLYQWHHDYRHHWILHTRYIPDYPLDFLGFNPAEHEAIVQKHRACEWTSNVASIPVSDEDRKLLELGNSAGPVVQNDLLLTLDGSCAKEQITAIEPKAIPYSILPISNATNPYWNAKLATGFWRYEKIVADEAMRSRSWWSPAEPQKSGQEHYKELLKSELRSTGYGLTTANTIAEKCIKAERRWCIEKHNLTRLRIWPVVKSDPFMFSGIVLGLIGLAGSVFYSPMFWLGQMTIGRLLEWIRHGR